MAHEDEKIARAQRLQLDKAKQQGQLLEKHLDKLDGDNDAHENSLVDLEAQMAALAGESGAAIGGEATEGIEGLVELSQGELKAIDASFEIPMLEALDFADWESYVADSDRYLAENGFDSESDLLLQTLGTAEINEVLEQYRGRYGEVLPDGKDMAVVFAAGLTGMLLGHLKKAPGPVSGKDLVRELSGEAIPFVEQSDAESNPGAPVSTTESPLGNSLLSGLAPVIDDLLAAIGQIQGLISAKGGTSVELGAAARDLFARIFQIVEVSTNSSPDESHISNGSAEAQVQGLLSNVVEAREWLENSGLEAEIPDLIDKLKEEGLASLQDDGRRELAKVVSTQVLGALQENKTVDQALSKLGAESPVVELLINNKESLSRILSLVEITRGDSDAVNRLAVDPTALPIVSDVLSDVGRVLNVAPTLPGIVDLLGRSPEEVGSILSESGLSLDTLAEFGYPTCIVELIVRGWLTFRSVAEGADCPKEPYAVKSSLMLASAHVLTNSKAAVELLAHAPPQSLNVASLGLSVHYGIKALNEYRKRQHLVESDADEAMSRLYRNSTEFARRQHSLSQRMNETLS